MKKDQEERLEAKRLEDERLQIQLAFEKEQQAARVKKDEENKNALLIQAEVLILKENIYLYFMLILISL